MRAHKGNQSLRRLCYLRVERCNLDEEHQTSGLFWPCRDNARAGGGVRRDAGAASYRSCPLSQRDIDALEQTGSGLARRIEALIVRVTRARSCLRRA